MKLSIFLSVGILFCSISAFSQNVASTATLTSGGLNAGTSGNQNTFYGHKTGNSNSSGAYNTFIGNEAGNANTTGSQNTLIGYYAGMGITTGSQNTYLGHWAGGESNGDYNTCIGFGAGGESSSGSGNVYIGHHVGWGMENNNKLFIDNTDTFTPLIWGDFAQDQLKFNGKVGIGYGFGNFPTTAGSVNVSNYNLFVKGGILTEEVRVNLQGDWADYVFSKDYELMPLQKIEIFIKENGHLPNMPSAKQVKEEGIELGQIAKMQQEKIEELTLHMIEQNKTIEKQSEEIKELKELVKQLIEK